MAFAIWRNVRTYMSVQLVLNLLMSKTMKQAGKFACRPKRSACTPLPTQSSSLAKMALCNQPQCYSNTRGLLFSNYTLPLGRLSKLNYLYALSYNKKNHPGQVGCAALVFMIVWCKQNSNRKSTLSTYYTNSLSLLFSILSDLLSNHPFL